MKVIKKVATNATKGKGSTAAGLGLAVAAALASAFPALGDAHDLEIILTGLIGLIVGTVLPARKKKTP